MRPSQRKRRRLVFIAASGAATVLLVVAVWLGGEGLLSTELAGTMGSEGALAMGTLDARWEGGAADGLGGLDDAIQVQFDAFNPLREDRRARFALFFSRDADFDESTDCRVADQELLVPGGGRAPVRIQSAAHLVNCLDAGPWRAAVLDLDSGLWKLFDEPIVVRGGAGSFTPAVLPREVGFGGNLELGLDVTRFSGAYGTEGLWDQDVDVWLQRENEVCLIAAPSVSLPRDPVRRAQGTSVTDRVSTAVKLGDARKVDLGTLPNPFAEESGVPNRADCPGCVANESAGRCSLGEGEWQLTVGPAGRAERTIGTVYVHARPSNIDATPIAITLSEGEAGSVERMAYNPSQRSVEWSSFAGDDFSGDWMVGTSRQSLAGRKPTPVGFTFSAAELTPGVYTGEYVFRAADFYRTEIRIPVELTVTASRKGGTDPSGVQSFSLSNYPNPFSGRTTIQVDVERDGRFRLAVYDIQGREVRLVADEWMSVGRQEISFDAGDLPSGTYLYRLTGEGVTVSGTMSLVK